MKNYGFAGVNYVPGFGFVEDPIRKALGPSDRASAFSGDTDVMMISGLGSQGDPRLLIGDPNIIAQGRRTAPAPSASQWDWKRVVLFGLAAVGAWVVGNWLLDKVKSA